ncbi:MAG: response regulator receiver protein [uncultured bacterium]|nr:MAG: response regulator receiver protein [uncultured bacterium]KKQ46443.1 MAG: Response regulator receiver protein [Candidatus Moranbacteria bacterium GW2011_GWC2_37_8]KKQ63062.1 MAG: Response regulator receiver protein [Parcubacteria group bacterium GW2011_GWC1_38_22]KKQ80400.1 MAG: Response regulator receiver protein [Candidatus Moranbacteria bacterium GW2011_GWD2_38_7]
MNKRLLIIEDDTVLQKALSSYLTAESFEVMCALDGEEGVKMAISEKPDLILLDIVLPKKDGYQVLQEVKANEESKHIPIVLLTNLGSIADVEKALEMGATTYLVKADYKLEEVTAKIKEILNIK